MQNRETRFLPTLLEWARIVMLTSPADRSATQQEMMKYADRYHVCASSSPWVFVRF